MDNDYFYTLNGFPWLNMITSGAYYMHLLVVYTVCVFISNITSG